MLIDNNLHGATSIWVNFRDKICIWTKRVWHNWSVANCYFALHLTTTIYRKTLPILISDQTSTNLAYLTTYPPIWQTERQCQYLRLLIDNKYDFTKCERGHVNLSQFLWQNIHLNKKSETQFKQTVILHCIYNNNLL